MDAHTFRLFRTPQHTKFNESLYRSIAFGQPGCGRNSKRKTREPTFASEADKGFS